MAGSASVAARSACNASVSELALCGRNQSCGRRDSSRLAMRRSMWCEGANGELAAACFKKTDGLPAQRRQFAASCRLPDGHGSPFFENSFFKSYARRSYVPDVVHPDPASDDTLLSSFRDAVDRAYPSEAEVAFSKNFDRLSSDGVGPVARDYVAAERGCVLVATRKLDGHSTYSRSVILLTEGDDKVVRGVVLNKPLPAVMCKRLAPIQGMASEWTEEIHGEFPTVHVGGPLQSASSPVTVLTSTRGLRGFDRLIPGLYIGEDSALQTVLHSCSTGYMESAEARLFVGAVQWTREELQYQIEVSQWWEVAEGHHDEVRWSDGAKMWEPFDTLYSREIKPEGNCGGTGQELMESRTLKERAL